MIVTIDTEWIPLPPRVRWLALGGAVAFLAFLYSHPPLETFYWLQCPFHLLTGLYCPGCGSLRACYHLLHGRVAIAFDYNPVTTLFLPFLAYAFLSDLLLQARGKPLPRLAWSHRWTWAFVSVYFAFGILRNLPYYPLSLLAP